MNSENHANLQKMKHVFPIAGSLIVFCHSAFSMIQRHYSLLTLSLFMYADLILVQYCNHAFQKLPPRQKSLRRSLLKLALSLLFSGIFFALVSQSAPFYGPLAAALLYAMAVGAAAFVFYAYMIYDGDGGSENCQDHRNFPVVELNSISEKL